MAMNYPPEPTGTAPYTGALAAGLVERGYQVQANVAHPYYPEWIIREGYGDWSSVERRDGVAVHRFLHYVPRYPRPIKRLLSELSFGLRLLFSRIGRTPTTVAVSPPLFATAMVVLRHQLTPGRRRLIIWVQDIYTLGLAEIGEGSRLARRIAQWLESHTFRAADLVVVIHDRFKEFVTQELEVPASKVVVVRNWTHLPAWEAVDRTTARRQLGWPQEGTLAVHTGNMGAKQGLVNLIDAARLAQERAAPVHFLLVGDGTERQTLESLARDIANVTFIAPLDADAYRLALAAADVLLVNEKPGVASMAVPSKLTSYFSAGRPIVAATDPTGIAASEITAAQAGVVVPAGDPESLLQAIINLRCDTAAAARFGLNGQAYRASVLDQGAAIRRWAELIDELGEPAIRN